MFCINCSKLAILDSEKKCIKCENIVYNNISLICDSCSLLQQICSICLKKYKTGLNSSVWKGGCKSCG